MKSFFHAFIDKGSGAVPENIARKIRLVNIIALIAIVTSTVYLVYYLSISAFLPFVFNLVFIGLYGAGLYINRRGSNVPAISLILFSHMAHLLVLSLFVFTPETGFHYYFLVIPPISFLVFNYNQKGYKFVFSGIPVSLFFLCHARGNASPLILLPEWQNQMLYMSSILILSLGLIFVVYLFTVSIKKYEEAREDMIYELQTALSEVHTLKGFLPICSSCKKIRDDKGYWSQVEVYIAKHSDATFSHGICPDCSEQLYGGEAWFRNLEKGGQKK